MSNKNFVLGREPDWKFSIIEQSSEEITSSLCIRDRLILLFENKAITINQYHAIDA